MSAETHDDIVRQAPDELPRSRIAVAWLLLERWGDDQRRTAPPPVAPRTIGTLEQTLILRTERGVELRKEQMALLSHWEWVDRDAGVARIPIEAAIDVLAASPLPPDRPLEPAGAERTEETP